MATQNNNYATASLYVLTAAADFNTEATEFQYQGDVPGDDSFTSTNGTVRVGNINISADNKAKRTWLTGKRPISGQLFPRGNYVKVYQ
jgi:hypothetical protein